MTQHSRRFCPFPALERAPQPPRDSACGRSPCLPVATRGQAPVFTPRGAKTEEDAAQWSSVFPGGWKPRHRARLSETQRDNEGTPPWRWHISMASHPGLGKPGGSLSVGSRGPQTLILRAAPRIPTKCFTLTHWAVYNVFIRREYLETITHASGCFTLLNRPLNEYLTQVGGLNLQARQYQIIALSS